MRGIFESNNHTIYASWPRNQQLGSLYNYNPVKHLRKKPSSLSLSFLSKPFPSSWSDTKTMGWERKNFPLGAFLCFARTPITCEADPRCPLIALEHGEMPVRTTWTRKKKTTQLGTIFASSILSFLYSFRLLLLTPLRTIHDFKIARLWKQNALLTQRNNQNRLQLIFFKRCVILVGSYFIITLTVC